jgi:hypothetical protein
MKMYANERKLRKSGFDNEIKDGRITINSGKEVEVYVVDADGDHDYDATDELSSKVAKALGWGGFKCGWGGWLLQKNYQSFRQFNTR